MLQLPNPPRAVRLIRPNDASVRASDEGDAKSICNVGALLSGSFLLSNQLIPGTNSLTSQQCCVKLPVDLYKYVLISVETDTWYVMYFDYRTWSCRKFALEFIDSKISEALSV